MFSWEASQKRNDINKKILSSSVNTTTRGAMSPVIAKKWIKSWQASMNQEAGFTRVNLQVLLLKE